MIVLDTFCEQILKQSMDGKRIGIIVLTVAAALVLSVVSLLWLPWLFFPVAALSGFGIYWVSSMQSWEVEYAVTNGEIDIDRIIACRERKKIVRVRGEKIESLLPVSKTDMSKKYDRVVMAARSAKTATWAFTYKGKMGSTLVLFEPDENVLAALRDGLSRTVRIETDRVLREM